jgi:hypothetical protein
MRSTRTITIPAAIIRSGEPAPTVDALAGLMNVGRPAVAAAISRAIGRGEVEYWEAEDRASLTPLQAEKMRVRIAGNRWRDGESPDPSPRVGKGRSDTTNEADLVAVDARKNLDRLLLDRQPSAEAVVEHLERAEAEVAALAAREGNGKRTLPLLYPKVLVGTSEPWGVASEAGYWGEMPGRRFAPHCPACRGRRLGLAEACLRCSRTGLDAFQPADTRPRRKAKRRARPRPGPRLKALVALLEMAATIP